MDPVIAAAARALTTGDALGALNFVALRDDAPALALRGIAMAQLGDLQRAKTLIRAAARAFGTRDAVAKSRCVVADAELALATRELASPGKSLETARQVLEDHGDRMNAAHARYLQIRRHALIGEFDAAEKLLKAQRPNHLPPALRAVHELIVAGIALRRIRTRPARAALIPAGEAARESRIAALGAEVDRAAQLLAAPAAKLLSGGQSLLMTLPEVEALFGSRTLTVDACRYEVRGNGRRISLARRPILFTLVRVMAETWPAQVPRDTLIQRAFRLPRADESSRARLRVEIGRLRRALRDVADIRTTPAGFALMPTRTDKVAVLTHPIEDDNAAVLALLADGEAWSTSSLALALGVSQRSVQRALDELSAARKVQAFGAGRARRWLTPPLPGIATVLLLPAPLPSD